MKALKILRRTNSSDPGWGSTMMRAPLILQHIISITRETESICLHILFIFKKKKNSTSLDKLLLLFTFYTINVYIQKTEIKIFWCVVKSVREFL